MTDLRWTEEAKSLDGVCERGFAVERNGQTIPGVLWSPATSSGPRPLVLLGHGGSAHKRHERMEMLGRLFAKDYGWCAAAIDGPVHGERGPVSDANDPVYRAMWQRPEVVQDMIDDWKATLDALRSLVDVDSSRVGYWGVSMGTMFGLPYVASDARVRVAVLGKAGMSGSSVRRSGIDTHFKSLPPRSPFQCYLPYNGTTSVLSARASWNCSISSAPAISACTPIQGSTSTTAPRPSRSRPPS
jgi:pimeloyl-ACP methyl ester carboxylesterase